MAQLGIRLTILFLLLTLPSAAQEIALEAFPAPMRRPIAEPVLYRLFLEQVAAFEQQIRTEESRGQSGEAFRHHLRHQFGLTREDVSSIAPIALQFHREVSLLRRQQEAVALRFRTEAFPNGTKIALSSLPFLPPELSRVDQQIEILSRKARDEMQAILRRSRFMELNSKLHQRDSFYKGFPQKSDGSSEQKAVSGVYAYSSLDLDSATKQITAYAVTEMDGALRPYYQPQLWVLINNRSRERDFASLCRTPSPNTVTCRFAASSSAYILDTEHGVRLLVRDSTRRQWIDPLAYEYVSSLDIMQPFAIQFMGQGPPMSVSDQVFPLGHTFVWSDQ